jgi:hypothetical protein
VHRDGLRKHRRNNAAGGVITGRRQRTPIGGLLMSYLKAKLSLPVVKYSLLTFGSVLWTFGLVDQLYSSAAVMKYLLMSLLIAAIAVL